MTEEERLATLGELYLRCQDAERSVVEVEAKVKRLRRIMEHMLTAMKINVVFDILLLGALIILSTVK